MSEVKTVPIEEFARKVLLRGVHRIYHDANFLQRIPTAYALWEFDGSKHLFGAERDYLFEHVEDGHKACVQEYKRRITTGEKKLPFIVVHLLEDGNFIVWDGNRRCLALMYLTSEEVEGLELPAFVLDHRPEPY